MKFFQKYCKDKLIHPMQTPGLKEKFSVQPMHLICAGYMHTDTSNGLMINSLYVMKDQVRDYMLSDSSIYCRRTGCKTMGSIELLPNGFCTKTQYSPFAIYSAFDNFTDRLIDDMVNNSLLTSIPVDMSQYNLLPSACLQGGNDIVVVSREKDKDKDIIVRWYTANELNKENK